MKEIKNTWVITPFISFNYFSSLEYDFELIYFLMDEQYQKILRDHYK